MSASQGQDGGGLPPVIQEKKSGGGFGIAVLVLVILLAAVGAGYYVWLQNQGPKLTGEAAILVNTDADNDQGILPHTISDSTAFPESMEFLAADVEAPEVIHKHEEKGREFLAVNPHNITINVEDAKNWDGLVLLPDRGKMSKAYSTDVAISRIEAHPLIGGGLRVWARIGNASGNPLKLQVACSFRPLEGETPDYRFMPLTLKSQEKVDVMFLSPISDIKSYTILVK